jgi:hypothetical protein
MPASIAYHMPQRQRPVGVAESQLSPVRRHEIADQTHGRRPADDHRPNRTADLDGPASSAL